MGSHWLALRAGLGRVGGGVQWSCCEKGRGGIAAGGSTHAYIAAQPSRPTGTNTRRAQALPPPAQPCLSCSTTSSRACSTYAPHPLLPSSPLLLMGLAACWLAAGRAGAAGCGRRGVRAGSRQRGWRHAPAGAAASSSPRPARRNRPRDDVSEQQHGPAAGFPAPAPVCPSSSRSMLQQQAPPGPHPPPEHGIKQVGLPRVVLLRHHQAHVLVLPAALQLLDAPAGGRAGQGRRAGQGGRQGSCLERGSEQLRQAPLLICSRTPAPPHPAAALASPPRPAAQLTRWRRAAPPEKTCGDLRTPQCPLCAPRPAAAGAAPPSAGAGGGGARQRAQRWHEMRGGGKMGWKGRASGHASGWSAAAVGHEWAGMRGAQGAAGQSAARVQRDQASAGAWECRPTPTQSCRQHVLASGLPMPTRHTTAAACTRDRGMTSDPSPAWMLMSVGWGGRAGAGRAQ